MFYYFIYILIVFIVHKSSEQYLLGTHFYVNQDDILIDNTLKTVSTLARPYDLVAFIRQSERLARVDHLQTYIDAVDDVGEESSQQEQTEIHDKQETTEENNDKCKDFTRDGESLIFKILKTNLYDTFHIPFQLRNISNNHSTDNIDKKTTTKILTCNHFCHLNTSLFTFDHLPSISTRYDEQQAIRIDDEEITNLTPTNYNKEALWSINELSHNRTSWLAYVYLSRYYYSNYSYDNAIDCLRCALTYGSKNDDIILIELANIVFRYGYIRDAIIFIERALDHHLRSKITNIKSLFIRSILHYFLGNLCTIDNRFLLAIQFYNRTNILLERVKKLNDEQQVEILSSSSLGSLTISSLSSLSQQKIDALRCHLTLEFSLQHKHHILQTKLAQLNQLRSITDELIHLNSLIKRDMSNGQSFLDYLRQIKEEQKQIICDWKQTKKRKFSNHHLSNIFFSNKRKYSAMMKQEEFCSIGDNYLFIIKTISDNYDCRPRDNIITIEEDIDLNNKQLINRKQSRMALRLATIERTQSSSYVLEDDKNQLNSFETSDQITLTSTTTWPTLTSRLPTDVIIQPAKEFFLKQSNELYPPLKQNTIIKLNEQQLPTYIDCQIHYYGLPSIGDYPTVWLPLENKGLLNIKQAFYQGLDHQNKHYPLPWSPPLCTLYKPIDEHLSVIQNHRVLTRTSRIRAPINRYDTNMLLNLYLYIDSTIDEQLPIEEFGQRLRSVGENRENLLLPEWIINLLSSLYWRVNGHLPHAIDCGLKAHETIIKNKNYKQWGDLTLVNLANILYLWGKYEDALDLTQQAYSINSHEPITNYLLGNLLALTKNNHTAAQEYYRRTLTIDPTHIYARRQLRLSYCYTMHTTWEMMGCADNKNNCDEKTILTESMKCNLMLSHQNYKPHDTTMALANSNTYSSSYHHQNTQCERSIVDNKILDNRSSVDRWLNRSCIITSIKRDELLNDARRAYRLYGLCSSSSIINNNYECSQGFAVTNQGIDIGHLIIIYDHIKQTFDYSYIFTNDYENFFLKESKLKCLIYGTGRKSSKCRDLSLNILDPNELNPKHNMTWWRDRSTLYEHLKELIEIMNYDQQLNNISSTNENDFYEKYLSNHYILSKEVQEKYLLINPINLDKNDCQNKSTTVFTPYLSTWISPQTKNIYLNNTFFKQLKKDQIDFIEPICSEPVSEQINNLQFIDYIIKKAKTNLTLYRPETILKPILLNLLFEKNPTMMNRGGDDKTLIGSTLASGLNSSVYNNSWLFFHTLSLYWRLMGNASQALNCLFQSHILSPSNVQDLTYLSMALILYNSQLHINEAIYLLYESLSIDKHALLLTHFALGNAMARKGHLNFAEQWYQSTLKLKSDFEPAKQRLRAIQC